MIKKTIKIELLSDMCCGTGEGNGSHIDVMTSFDEAGIPIIPAKRLKGLIRENAEDLVRWGFGALDESSVENLFGGLYGKESGVKIGNAEIENSVAIKGEILSLIKNKDSTVTKDAVSDCFTSLRSQTKIDEHGIAEDHSLRTTQVVKKGASFFFTVTASDKLSKKEIKLLDSGIKSLRHIGFNKSRGLGEVKCSIVKNEIIGDQSKKISIDTTGNVVTVPYTITLLQDVVMSSGSNFEPDYISGSMLLGAFSKLTSDYDWFKDVVLKGTVFSNAYISVNGEVFTPTPLSLTAIKNKPDKAFSTVDGYEKFKDNQYVGIGGYSRIDGNSLFKAPVESALSYHHSTQKSAMGQNLFTIRKLLSGQTFKGTVTAPKEYINALEKVLSDNGDCLSLGGAASAQYSSCSMIFGQAVEEKPTEIYSDTIIEFISDVITVDKMGNNSTNCQELLEEIKNHISFDAAEIFSKIVTVGGFNSKWKLPKRQYSAFVKGSVIKLTGCKAKKVNKTLRIGVLRNEGYGEIRIRSVYENNSFHVRSAQVSENSSLRPSASKKTVDAIVRQHTLINVNKYAIETANAMKKSFSDSSSMRMLKAYQTLKPCKDYRTRFTEHCSENFKKNEELKKYALDAINKFDGFKTDIKIDDDFKDELFRGYIFSFICQVKRNNQKGGNAE